MRTEDRNNSVAKGLCGPALPADGDCELMSRLSTAAFSAASKSSVDPSTILQRHSGLNPGSAKSIQLLEMQSGAVNSSKHRTHLKRDCSKKAKMLCSDTGSGEKGSRFKVSCPQMSLKKISLDRDHRVSEA